MVFRELVPSAGLAFRHVNGMFGGYTPVEVIGGGVGLADFDGDGDLDIYLVQSGRLDPATGRADTNTPAGDRMFRNLLVEVGELRWEDATPPAVAERRGYGMGLATGDYDNDGDIDVYVTNWGHNQLLANQGHWSFLDVTAQAEVDDPRWSTSASFVDLDLDGWLDLFVANYVEIRPAECFSTSSARDYCGPESFAPVGNRIFRNAGSDVGGAPRFEDATAGFGATTAAPAASLGVVAADFDRNGWPDVYVANDAMANELWLNHGAGPPRLLETALLGGCALNRDGRPEASMGVVAADFDGDLDEDLFLTHLDGETNTYYQNDGNGTFVDRSLMTGLAEPSRPYTGFGVAAIDFDNDGWLDLAVANGAVRTIAALVERGDPFPLGQRNLLFRNRGRGEFELVEAGAVFGAIEVSRGLAMGDLDNDGDSDLVVVNNNGPARVLLNQVGQDSSWLGLRVVERGRDAVGATVRVVPVGEPRPELVRRVATDGSYLSASDPRVLFGLAGRAVASVEVRWADGALERWSWQGRGVDRYHVVHRGTGTPDG